MFHPNILANGLICLGILHDKRNGVYNVFIILISIQYLLCDPNPDSPANLVAARIYKKVVGIMTNRSKCAWNERLLTNRMFIVR